MAKSLSYGEKLEIVNRDALRAVAALVAIVIVWLVCGFGLAGLDVTIFHTPLWVVAGLLGTWAAAIIAVVVLSKRFVDFDLGEEEPEELSVALTDAPSGAPAKGGEGRD